MGRLLLWATLLGGMAWGQQATVLRRVPAGGEWDVVARVARSTDESTRIDRRFNWSLRQQLVVLFENRMDPRSNVRVVAEPGPNNDCYARIERMDARVLVVSCIGEKWSTYENHEFRFDPGTRTLVSHFVYMPFKVARIGPDGAVMGQLPEEGADFMRVAPDSAGRPRVTGPAQAPLKRDPQTVFGALRIVKRANRYGSTHSTISISGRVYPLAQSDLAAWKVARPDDVGRSLPPDPSEENEEIGPYQWVEGKLWFGKTFYNSEGLTGVGGFGYFDPTTRAYQIYSPAEIQRWSVSAILVEADAVWLALCGRHEYGDESGGLLRWDRATSQIQRFAMDQIGTHIARLGGALWVGAFDGLVVLDGDKPVSYLVDRGADGKWEIAERNR